MHRISFRQIQHYGPGFRESLNGQNGSVSTALETGVGRSTVKPTGAPFAKVSAPGARMHNRRPRRLQRHRTEMCSDMAELCMMFHGFAK